MQDLQELSTTRIKTTRSNMAVQFAILDDRGQIFGMRATTYTSLEAAEQALTFLQERRRGMEDEARKAADDLALTKGWDNDTLDRREALKEAVKRWENEKERSYSIMRREVSPWTPL